MAQPKLIGSLVLIPFICMLPDITYKLMQKTFYPTPADILLRCEKMNLSSSRVATDVSLSHATNNRGIVIIEPAKAGSMSKISEDISIVKAESPANLVKGSAEKFDF